ncbi:RHE_PE00001 family protein [Pinisolibacter sp.]|uniref:RHE_PE00001 family protein n=1 Tax=Pinisolibacter sp. TaxID=2172024 RepID=UPI002FDEE6AF
MSASMMRSLPTRLDALPWHRLAPALAAAEDALARLDERIARSPIRDGWCERNRFTEAASSLLLDGTLVQLEDLVLHDAGLDARAPSPELTRAHAHLRRARRLATLPPGATLDVAGLLALVGRGAPKSAGAEPPPLADGAESEGDDAWATTLGEVDALLARTDRLLARATLPSPDEPTGWVRPARPDRDERLARWVVEIEAIRDWPATLAAARALVAWEIADPLPEEDGLGRLLVADLLRARGKVRSHLVDVASGLRAVAPERRRHRDPLVRLQAVLDGMALGATRALEDHDRRLTARDALLRRIGPRRTSSRLPQLVELVIAAPLVTTETIADTLGVTPRAASGMVAELGLREITGRGRFRAWAVG